MFCHDWGSAVTFAFVKKYPQFVKRIISLDIGGHIKVGRGFILVCLSYQLFNVFCFLIGDPAGGWMTRTFLKQIRYKGRNLREISASTNYLYWYIIKRFATFQKMWYLKPTKQFLDQCPILFIYGKKKLGMFHSLSWVERL